MLHYVVKLLSPPKPSTHTGQRNHLIDYMPMLSAILSGASSIDTVHVLSLHGLVGEVLFLFMVFTPRVCNDLRLFLKQSHLFIHAGYYRLNILPSSPLFVLNLFAVFQVTLCHIDVCFS